MAAYAVAHLDELDDGDLTADVEFFLVLRGHAVFELEGDRDEACGDLRIRRVARTARVRYLVDAVLRVLALPFAVLAVLAVEPSQAKVAPYRAAIAPLSAPLPAQLAGRFWRPGCPVSLSQLRLSHGVPLRFRRPCARGPNRREP